MRKQYQTFRILVDLGYRIAKIRVHATSLVEATFKALIRFAHKQPDTTKYQFV